MVAVLFPRAGLSETVTLPLTLDYPLLRALVIKTAFTEPGHAFTLIDKDHGCKRVVISEPRFSQKDALVLFETRVFVRTGLYLGKMCILPMEWEGYVTLLQRPKIDGGWSLSFETVDSAIYDKLRKRARIAGVIWNYVKKSVYAYMEGITLDLGPPVSELKLFFEDVFPQDIQGPARKMVNSMRPGEIQITSDAVKVGVLMDVEGSEPAAEDRAREMISEENLRKFISSWETWDAFLVNMIESLSTAPLTDHERQILMDTLLETRYRFTSELTNETLGRDFVREEFVRAWKEVSLIFRGHLTRDPSRSILSYLAFFTAADGLLALDRIGPGLGLEISRNGLIRLAQLISDGVPVTLDYRYGVDTTLREILGMGPPVAITKSAYEGDWIDLDMEPQDTEDDRSLLHTLMRFLFRPAWAGNQVPEALSENVKKWILPKGDPEPYIEKVKPLLIHASSPSLEKEKIQDRYHDLFRSAVLATAWQESCFRQFELKGNRITYIRSYNGTSVGIMQINERVWRGLYDEKHLRWDIEYNVMAGCEILALYFRQYALMESKGINPQEEPDDVVLARVTYAVYNAGPGERREFLKRKKQGHYSRIDKLFFEKYQWVKNDQWEKAKECL